MKIFLLTCVLTSVIDRGGIPAALVAGVVALNRDYNSIIAFALACAVAGLAGDMVMYWIGLKMRQRRARRKSIFDGASIYQRIEQASAVVVQSPFNWLVWGRAFQLINQFVPMAAGVIGYSFARTLAYCMIGNLLWFGVFAALTLVVGLPLRRFPVQFGIIGAVAGVTLLTLLMRRIHILVVEPKLTENVGRDHDR